MLMRSLQSSIALSRLGLAALMVTACGCTADQGGERGAATDKLANIEFDRVSPLDIIGPPSAAQLSPSNIVATSYLDKISVSWATGATLPGEIFSIWRSLDNVHYSEVGTSPTPSFTDFGVANGTTYYYQVAAVYGSNWYTLGQTASAVAKSGQCPQGMLASGKTLTGPLTCNGFTLLLHQSTDGNLVVLDKYNSPVWSTVTGILYAPWLAFPTGPLYPTNTVTAISHGPNAHGNVLSMDQASGNLILYRAGVPVWSSGTNIPGAVLFMRGDGDLAIYKTLGMNVYKLWSLSRGLMPVPMELAQQAIALPLPPAYNPALQTLAAYEHKMLSGTFLAETRSYYQAVPYPQPAAPTNNSMQSVLVYLVRAEAWDQANPGKPPIFNIAAKTLLSRPKPVDQSNNPNPDRCTLDWNGSDCSDAQGGFNPELSIVPFPQGPKRSPASSPPDALYTLTPYDPEAGPTTNNHNIVFASGSLLEDEGE